MPQINKTEIKKQIVNIINNILIDWDEKQELFKLSDSDKTLNLLYEEQLAELIMEVEDKFNIDIEYFINNIKTLDDLCEVVTMSISKKQEKQKTPIVINPKQYAKTQILNEISKWIVDSGLVQDNNPTFNTKLEQGFSFIDPAIYKAIEQKYNIALGYMDNVYTVEELCDRIIQKRLELFQKTKKYYNEPIQYTTRDAYTVEPMFRIPGKVVNNKKIQAEKQAPFATKQSFFAKLIERIRS